MEIFLKISQFFLLISQQNEIKNKKNPLLSVFGQIEAHFSTKLSKKYNIPLYWPFGDLRLIFQQNQIKNKKSPFTGLRPIWGSFLNTFKTLNHLLSAFGAFVAQFLIKFK